MLAVLNTGTLGTEKELITARIAGHLNEMPDGGDFGDIDVALFVNQSYPEVKDKMLEYELVSPWTAGERLKTLKKDCHLISKGLRGGENAYIILVKHRI